jgi:hypothetical protein
MYDITHFFAFFRFGSHVDDLTQTTDTEVPEVDKIVFIGWLVV